MCLTHSWPQHQAFPMAYSIIEIIHANWDWSKILVIINRIRWLYLSQHPSARLWLHVLWDKVSGPCVLQKKKKKKKNSLTGWLSLVKDCYWIYVNCTQQARHCRLNSLIENPGYIISYRVGLNAAFIKWKHLRVECKSRHKSTRMIYPRPERLMGTGD